MYSTCQDVPHASVLLGATQLRQSILQRPSVQSSNAELTAEKKATNEMLMVVKHARVRRLARLRSFPSHTSNVRASCAEWHALMDTDVTNMDARSAHATTLLSRVRK